MPKALTAAGKLLLSLKDHTLTVRSGKKRL